MPTRSRDARQHSNPTHEYLDPQASTCARPLALGRARTHTSTHKHQSDMEVLQSVKPYLRNFAPQWEKEMRDDAKRREMIERLAVCFLSHQSSNQVLGLAQVSPSLIYMLPPFIVCTQDEAEAFYCFRELQQRLARDLSRDDSRLNLRLAQFVTLYKTILPDVNMALEEEEVEVNEWAVSWLRFLLCR